MNTNSEVRKLTDEEVDVVTGGLNPVELGTCPRYVGGNAWEQWIADYFHIYL
jgi:hypothetical protein